MRGYTGIYGTTHPRPPATCLGGDKDIVSLHSPMAREARPGVLAKESGHPPAQLPPAGWVGRRELLFARWMGGIKPDLVSLLSAKPGVLAALQLAEGRAGRGHSITPSLEHPAAPRRGPSRPFSPLLTSPSSLWGGEGAVVPVPHP